MARGAGRRCGADRLRLLPTPRGEEESRLRGRRTRPWAHRRLLPSQGPAFNPNDVDARVAAFYEKTADFEFDVWSEWCGAFRPFGGALAAIFSRRLQQLNVPLSPLDTKLGITSNVVQLKEQSGRIVYTAWVRDVVATKRTLYAGSYSICHVPGYPGPCVKVVFPLPNGSAMVIMRPESGPDGSFTVRSVGVRFGDPGFYFSSKRSQAAGGHVTCARSRKPFACTRMPRARYAPTMTSASGELGFCVCTTGCESALRHNHSPQDRRR